MINYTSTFTLNRQKYHYIDLVKASKDYDIELDSLPYTIKENTMTFVSQKIT